jgi:molybdopterin-guanine dinucleotide biosynthesis protein A
LTNAFPNISPGLAGRLKITLGSIIFLQDALPLHNLERLLNVNEDQINSSPSSLRGTLVHLHSVVIVPEDDEHVIRVLHPSFFDFFTNRNRCRNPRLVVDARAQHTLLAHACLRAMKELKQNPCQIESPTMHNSEVADLPTRISKHIPAHVQYACRHWASHLTNAMVSDSLLEQLKEMCSEHLLHLVEACSLLGELRSLLISLDATQHVLTVCDIGYTKYNQLITVFR